MPECQSRDNNGQSVLAISTEFIVAICCVLVGMIMTVGLVGRCPYGPPYHIDTSWTAYPFFSALLNGEGKTPPKRPHRP